MTTQEPLVVLRTGTSAACAPSVRPLVVRGGLPACGVALHFLAAPAQRPEGSLGGPSWERLDLPLHDPWTGAPAGCVQLTVSFTCLGPLGCPHSGSLAAGARQVTDTGAPAQRAGEAAHRGLGISDPQRNTAAGMQDAGRRDGDASCGSDASSQERERPAATAPLPASEPWQEPVTALSASSHQPRCHAPGLLAMAAQVAGERVLPPGGHSCEVQGAVRRLCKAWVARLVGVLQPSGAPWQWRMHLDPMRGGRFFI